MHGEQDDLHKENTVSTKADDVSTRASKNSGPERSPKDLLRFIILDHDKEPLTQALVRLGFLAVDDWVDADLIFAHRTTHGQGSHKGLKADEVTALISRNGYYVEYTRGFEPWRHAQFNSLRCKYDEVNNRLSRLRPPVSRNALYAWLALDNEHIKQATIAALAILCQGYIAAYAAATEQFEAKVLEDQTVKAIGYSDMMDSLTAEQRFLLTEELAKRFEQVSQASWWSSVLTINDKELETKIALEFNDQDLSGYPKIMALLNRIKAKPESDDGKPRGQDDGGPGRVGFPTVAEAYSEIVTGLTG